KDRLGVAPWQADSPKTDRTTLYPDAPTGERSLPWNNREAPSSRPPPQPASAPRPTATRASPGPSRRGAPPRAGAIIARILRRTGAPATTPDIHDLLLHLLLHEPLLTNGCGES